MKRNRRRPGRVLAAESLETRCLLTVPDFALLDVNTTSETYQQLVSPQDYQGRVSGWYFGHAT